MQITGGIIMSILRPNGGWVIKDLDFDSITYDEGILPVSKNEFDKAIADYPKIKEAQEQELLAKRQAVEAKLEKLGLTADDLKALGLGNN